MYFRPSILRLNVTATLWTAAGTVGGGGVVSVEWLHRGTQAQYLVDGGAQSSRGVVHHVAAAPAAQLRRPPVPERPVRASVSRRIHAQRPQPPPRVPPGCGTRRRRRRPSSNLWPWFVLAANWKSIGPADTWSRRPAVFGPRSSIVADAAGPHNYRLALGLRLDLRLTPLDSTRVHHRTHTTHPASRFPHEYPHVARIGAALNIEA